MAQHRRFGFEFKRPLVLDFLEGPKNMRELGRKHSLSRVLSTCGSRSTRRCNSLMNSTLCASPSMRARSLTDARWASSPWKSIS